MTLEEIQTANGERIKELFKFYLQDQKQQGLLEMRVTFERDGYMSTTDIYRQILHVAVLKEAGLLERYNDSLVKRREKIPKYGDLFTKEEFTEMCKCGMLISSDGSGDLSDGVTLDPYESVSTSRVANGTFVWPEWATHVVWYNK